MLKKTALTLGSFFLAWQSYNLLSLLDEVDIHSWGIVLFVGWVLNMFITGIFAFLAFAFPVEQMLPASYYRIDQPARLQAAYRRLGVKLFRKALLATLWRSPEKRKKYFDGRESGLGHLEVQSQKSEFGHLITLALLTLASIYLFYLGHFKRGAATLFFNFLGNLYPVILQRHHRLRVQIILQRRQTFGKGI